MKTLLAIAATSLLALSAPAFAQNAGAPAASGVTGSLTGSNPGTGFGWNGPQGDSINPGPGPGQAYPNSPGNGNRGYLNEGRASAPDYGNGYHQGWNRGNGYHEGWNQGNRPQYNQGYDGGYNQQGYGYQRDSYAPAPAWRSDAYTPGVGADLVGPGSGWDNPIDTYDVSR